MFKNCAKFIQLSEIEIAKNLLIENCSSLKELKKLTIGGNASVTNCPSLEEIDGVIEGNLEVKNCPKLEVLNANVKGNVDVNFKGNKNIDLDSLAKWLCILKTGDQNRSVTVRNVLFSPAQLKTLSDNDVTVEMD